MEPVIVDQGGLPVNVPLARPMGLGPFPAVKTFSCGCRMEMNAPPDPATMRVPFVVDYSACRLKHVPVPAHANVLPSGA